MEQVNSHCENTVVHIDRNRLFREGLRNIFSDSCFSIVAGATSIEDGIEEIRSLNPRMILIDPTALDINEFPQFLKEFEKDGAPPAVVALTDYLDLSMLSCALHFGANGYLLKDVSPEALTLSLKLVLLGETVFPSHLASVLMQPPFNFFRKFALESKAAGELSPREIEILSCLVNGLPNKEIANQLNITDGTVKVHVKGILKKINAENRTQAAIWALQNGFGDDVAVTAPIPTALPLPHRIGPS